MAWTQTSHLLTVNGTYYVVDAGDGVARRMARAGAEVRDVGIIFLTHHHDDHTAGLATLMALAWDRQRTDPINVYGPPRTQELVDAAQRSVSLVGEPLPDFLAPERYHLWLDLGDLVVIRAQRPAFDQEETEQRFRTAREYIDQAAHSLPFVFVRGNHEEVNGWDDDGGANTTMVWSGKMLLKYFSPPEPDAFFSGNTTPHPQLGIPGNYFAFDVGDLRVRALDPFLFSTTREQLDFLRFPLGHLETKAETRAAGADADADRGGQALRRPDGRLPGRGSLHALWVRRDAGSASALVRS